LTIIDKSNIRHKMKTFGETLRDIREKKKVLLRQVAAELEIDTALISKIERGERKVSKEQVVKLATFLNVSKEELVTKWLSDKVLDILEEEPLALKALKMSEKRLKQN